MYYNIAEGSKGEKIFEEDFFKFFGSTFENLGADMCARKYDIDYETPNGMFWEVKNNYKDNLILIIEEKTNCDEGYGPITLGWIYTSNANYFVFVSEQTRTMIFVENTQKFKDHYHNIKLGIPENRNQVSIKDGKQWQSSFRRIPLKLLTGFYSFYVKPR